MFKRDWVIDPALGITILSVLALAFYLGWDIISLETEQRLSESYDKAYEAYKSDADINEFCGSFPESLRVQCALEEVAASKQWNQERRDLHAQEGMAKYALWMSLAAFASAIVALYGLILLRRTWFETKRTADITNRAFLMSERPHLFIGHLKSAQPLFTDFWKFTINENIDFFEVTFDIENHGKTPAIVKELRSHVHVAEYLPDTKFFHAGEVSNGEFVIPASGSVKAQQCLRGKISEDELNTIHRTRSIHIEDAPKLRVFFYVLVRYESVVGIADEIMSVFRYDPMCDDFRFEENSAFNYRKLGDDKRES